MYALFVQDFNEKCFKSYLYKESHTLEYSGDPPRDSISTESMNVTIQ